MSKVASHPSTTDAPYILPQLLQFAVRVDTLTPDPKNARTHGDRNLEVIRNSLSRFGQRLPIIVQKQGMVVRVGNGRLMIAQELGWEWIAALVVDESEVEAVQYALVDNRSAELADWDMESLTESLRMLQENAPEFSLAAFEMATLIGLGEGLTASQPHSAEKLASFFSTEPTAPKAFQHTLTVVYKKEEEYTAVVKWLASQEGTKEEVLLRLAGGTSPEEDDEECL